MPYKALGKAQAIIPSGTMKKKDSSLSSPELKKASQGENSIIFVVTAVINVQLISKTLNKILIKKSCALF